VGATIDGDRRGLGVTTTMDGIGADQDGM